MPEHAVAEHAAQFARWIAADGGLDLQLLGIGRNGHIGFNEPSGDGRRRHRARSSPRAWCPCIRSRPPTGPGISAEIRTSIPKRALTLGVASILALAREILVLAFGSSKSEAVARSPAI